MTPSVVVDFTDCRLPTFVDLYSRVPHGPSATFSRFRLSCVNVSTPSWESVIFVTLPKLSVTLMLPELSSPPYRTSSTSDEDDACQNLPEGASYSMALAIPLPLTYDLIAPDGWKTKSWAKTLFRRLS